MNSELTYDGKKIQVQVKYIGDSGVHISGISSFTKFESGEPVPKFSSVSINPDMLKHRRDLVLDCVNIYLQKQELYKKAMAEYKRIKSLNKDFNDRSFSNIIEYFAKVTAEDLIYGNM